MRKDALLALVAPPAIICSLLLGPSRSGAG